MRLLYKNVLFIVSLFLCLGIMYAIIIYYLQTKELKRSVDNEAIAIGHTIETFVKYNQEKYFTYELESPTLTREFNTILNHIVQQDLNKFIIILNPVSDTVFYKYSNDALLDIQPWPTYQVLYEGKFKDTHYQLTRYNSKGRIKIKTELQSPFGKHQLFLVRQADDYVSKIAYLRKGIVQNLAISLLLGLLVSIIVSIFLHKQIKKINLAMDSVLNGKPFEHLNQGYISEFNELFSSLSVLSKIINIKINKQKKQLKSIDYEKNILKTYANIKRERSLSIHRTNNSTIISDYAGEDINNMFVNSLSLAHKHLFIYGKVDEENVLEQASLINAIDFYLANTTNYDKVISDFLDVFGSAVEITHFLMITDNGKLIMQEYAFRELINERSITLKPGDIKWFHFCESNIDSKIEAYTANNLEDNFDNVFKDIAKLISHLESSVLIGVKFNG